LRQGLESLNRENAGRRTAYRTRGASLGACRVGSLDDVTDGLAVAEGERFR